MEKNNQVKCVIFDFNGTLFFDYQENKDAWNEISLKYRGRKYQDEEYDSMMGKTDRKCAEYIIPGADVSLLDKIGEEKEEIYLRLCVERKLGLEKDAIDFINKCKERGIRVMIASSAPKENMDWYIKNFHLDSYFSLSDIVAGRNDIPSKPAPDIFIYTHKLGGFESNECIAFEDAPGGLKAALGASFRRVYAIESPGMDSEKTKVLAPLVNWKWVNENIEEVLA